MITRADRKDLIPEINTAAITDHVTKENHVITFTGQARKSWKERVITGQGINLHTDRTQLYEQR